MPLDGPTAPVVIRRTVAGPTTGDLMAHVAAEREHHGLVLGTKKAYLPFQQEYKEFVQFRFGPNNPNPFKVEYAFHFLHFQANRTKRTKKRSRGDPFFDKEEYDKVIKRVKTTPADAVSNLTVDRLQSIETVISALLAAGPPQILPRATGG